MTVYDQRSTGHVWRGDTDFVTTGRGPHAHAGELVGREAEGPITLGLIGCERDVRVVEEQQVFALDVEHERLRVDRLATEDA